MSQINYSTVVGARDPMIESSPHAALGFVSCTQDGWICWRGRIERMPIEASFDVIYCHDDEVEKVWQTLSARQSAKRRPSASAG